MTFLLAWDYGFSAGVRSSLVAQLVKNPPAMRETWDRSLGWKIPWRRERLPTPGFYPREFHGQYSPWGLKVLDTTEQLPLLFHGFSGNKTAKVVCPFHHVIWSTCLFPGNADLDHLAQVVFVRLFHCQVTVFLPLHILVYFGRNSLCSLTLKE